MSPLILLLLVSCFATKTSAQTGCADLAVTDIKAENITQKKSTTDRYRFTVTVRNDGPDIFPATAGTDIKLFFSAPGNTKREMATQPVQQLNAGQTTMLVFEVNVGRLTRQLPDWDYMPFPVEICGTVTMMRKTTTQDCNPRNNTVCKKL